MAAEVALVRGGGGAMLISCLYFGRFRHTERRWIVSFEAVIESFKHVEASCEICERVA